MPTDEEMTLQTDADLQPEINTDDIEAQLAAYYERQQAEAESEEGQSAPSEEDGPKPEVVPEADPESTPESTPAPESPADKIKVGEQELSSDQLAEAVGLLNWAQSLTPEQVAAIQTATNPYQASQPVAAPSQPQPDPEPFLDERAQKEIEALNAKIEALQAPIVTMQQRAQLEQENLVASQITQAKQTFAADHNLSPEEIDALETSLAEAQIFSGLVQRHKSNYLNAAIEGLEMTYFSNPANREREIAAKLEQERASLAANKEKKLKAASLSGKSGSVSRAPAVPSTSEERFDAMAAELAQHMNQP